ncbi:putative GMC oxidoreductase [Triangularia setosa]|uniref:GMC oxidoreductase n=1 Tax=Triangularia setosa TaxID=2587417 RepID=A0AAN6W210_9PEZI|nr:putative GMC oxidoreductase [Podospora setosa]
MIHWCITLTCLVGLFISPIQAIKNTYDYVIVGGGTAGLTVGDRLSESGKYSVLVIEYGYLEPEGQRPGTLYNITSAPISGLNNKTFPVVVGCVVGGSSAVNGMVFQRGTAKDYDIWKELGDGSLRDSWNWVGMLRYFKKAIQLTPPKPETAAFGLRHDAQYWGRNFSTNHTIFATFGNVISPKIYPFYEAAKKVPGINVSPDAGSGQPGLQYYQTSTNPYTGERSYSRTGHWDGLNRANYDLLTATRVNKIIFDRNRAAGVQVYPRGERDKKTVIRARKEVILAAGAIHTPQILQLSGIGPADLLRRAGIPVKVDLPGVGYNFQDHTFIPAVSFSWSTSPPIPLHLNISVVNDGLGRTSLGLSIGLPVISPSSFNRIASRYESQDPAAYLPKGTHKTIIRGYHKQQQIYAREMRAKGFSFLRATFSGDPSFVPIVIHPVSRGTVLIDPATGSDVEVEPIVDYRAASNPIDVDVAVEEVKFLRRFLTGGELSGYNATEVVPGPGYESDEALASWVRANTIPSVYHPVGTAAKMPREWGGVVGDDLLVYGVRGLSVVDASIMPTIVAATTSMTVYAIAEKVSDDLDFLTLNYLIKVRAGASS